MIFTQYEFISLMICFGTYYSMGVGILVYLFYLDRGKPGSMIWSILNTWQKLILYLFIPLAPIFWPIFLEDLTKRKVNSK